MSAGDRTFPVAGSAKYNRSKKILLCWYGVALPASLTELKVPPGFLKIVLNKESTPYWFHWSKMLLPLPPHAKVTERVVVETP